MEKKKAFQKHELSDSHIKKKKGFWVKKHIARFPVSDSWHMDWLLLSLAVRKKSSDFTNTLM